MRRWCKCEYCRNGRTAKRRRDERDASTQIRNAKAKKGGKK